MLASVVKQIESYQIVSIVRGMPESQLPLFTEALIAGGIGLIEITLNSPNALQSISEIKRQYGSNITVGAGTVLDADQAREAIHAGAEFLLSPNLDEGMIAVALEADVVPVPGVMTPTEIVTAVKWGAPIVKLFPTSSLGPGYIKELKGPLDSVKMIAVGGIDDRNIRDYIQAGAMGVGIGSYLADKQLISSGQYSAISERARRLVQAIK